METEKVVENNLNTKTIKEAFGGEYRIKEGEHLIVKNALGATFFVKAGGKLTIELSGNCKVFAERAKDVTIIDDAGTGIDTLEIVPNAD